MSEFESPEEKRQRILDEVNKKLRQAGEDAAEYIPNLKLDEGFARLLRDLDKDPYGGEQLYEQPKITKHDELGQVAFSANEEN